MIKAKKLVRTYKVGKLEVPALRKVSIHIKKGEFVAIMGPSGSGKSTLLHQLGVIDTPDAGQLTIAGTNVLKLRQEERTRFRLENVGLIFQFYSLLPELTALENVYLPRMLQGHEKEDCIQKAQDLLKVLGLADRTNHKPSQLSGGEQQRVAIARALVNQPKILLADEPTANLDTASALNVVKAFKQINKKTRQTIVMVTHERYLGKYAKRIIKIKDGKIH